MLDTSITNAGLCISHPYMEPLFSKCNLLEGKRFRNKQCAHKGVHLLQYIVSENSKPEEQQLVLNKILCGIPVSESIDLSISLTNEDKEIVESLMNSLIQNWSTMKESSPEQLRLTMLQREGRLIETEDNWKLKVEKRTYDVLLESLPWSLSIIKLPWMEKVLHVQWR